MTKSEMARKRVWVKRGIFRCDQCGVETESPIGWAAIRVEHSSGHTAGVYTDALSPDTTLEGEIYLCCSRPCEAEMHFRHTRTMKLNVRRGRPWISPAAKLLDKAYQLFREGLHETKDRSKKSSAAALARNLAAAQAAANKEENDDDRDGTREAASTLAETLARAIKAGVGK